MSYVLEYAEAIQDGRILANDYIKAMYSRLADAALKPGKYHLDTDISDAHIDFIETFCKQSQGVMGEPLKLELFQKAKDLNNGRTLPVRAGIYLTSIEDVAVITAFDRAKIA